MVASISRPLRLTTCYRITQAISEVAAFGVPDERLGERVGVAFVPREAAKITLEDVVRHLKSKHIATFKLPEGVVAVDSLPS